MKGQFDTVPGARIEAIRFADDVSWDAAAMAQRLVTGPANVQVGSPGNDDFTVDNGGDTILEGVNQGTDTVHTWVTYSLPDNVENLVANGYININLWGNAGDNIDGPAGADTIIFAGNFGGPHAYGVADGELKGSTA